MCEVTGHIQFAQCESIEAVLARGGVRGSGSLQCKLEKADLRNADLTRARLGNALLKGADLRGAVLGGIDFKSLDMKDVRIDVIQAVDFARSYGAKIQ